MGTADGTPARIPVIDFSRPEYLKPGTPEWNSVISQVVGALKEYGCFKVLRADKFHPERQNAVFGEPKELFRLPSETKCLLGSVGDNKPHSYECHSPCGPQYEGTGIDAPTNLKNLESLANSVWPQGKPSFSKTLLSFSGEMSEMEKLIKRMLLEGLGVEKYMHELMDSTDYLMRLTKLKYEPAPQNFGPHLGLFEHRDKMAMAIIYQSPVGGLEVHTRDGEWINVEPSPASFLVLVGETFHAWTNGLLHPVYHCVRIAGNEARYSIVFFSSLKASYTVQAPGELVDEAHRKLFRPFSYLEFMNFCQKLRGESALNQFPS